jgi:hypothetical protein
MSNEDLKDELERLRKENEALKKGASSNIRMKVSKKGAISIYGMGHFPVTLYKEQWLKLLDMSTEIRAFIAANEAQLKKRDWSAEACGPGMPSWYIVSRRANQTLSSLRKNPSGPPFLYGKHKGKSALRWAGSGENRSIESIELFSIPSVYVTVV